ncbi:hypothetical protein CHU98_g3384 [Xylaria longipes]|nr:hypothetical protein CHU98_g3384 [Xylaria longipes]
MAELFVEDGLDGPSPGPNPAPAPAPAPAPGPGSGPSLEPTTRGELLSSKTTLQSRRRRARPADVEGAIAENDERERKLSRVSRWQHFLYHRHLPAKEADNIKSVYGDIAPTSYEYTAARQRLVDDQKNFKAHVLADMAKLLEKHAQQPSSAVLLDIEVEPSPARLRELANGAWSPENFFSVWKYMRGYVDYKKSSPLGQYYMKHMFQGLALEVTKWLRATKTSAAQGTLRRVEVHNFYFAMPKKEQFASVSKDCFAEVFEHQRNQKRPRTDDTAALAAAHGRFEIDEAPPPPPPKRVYVVKGAQQPEVAALLVAPPAWMIQIGKPVLSAWDFCPFCNVASALRVSLVLSIASFALPRIVSVVRIVTFKLQILQSFNPSILRLSYQAVTMRRIMKRKGKAHLIRSVEERDAQALLASSESESVSQGKRVRSGEHVRHDSDTAIFDTGYEADADDAGDSDNEFELLTGVTDFDDADLAEMLVQADDDEFVVQPDEDGVLRVIDEDMPNTTELQALADYQQHGEDVETHEDEAEGIFDEDDTVLESMTEGRPTPAELDPTPASLTSATISGEEPEGVPAVDPFESSTIVKHTRRRHDMNDFTMALGLYCTRNGVSRKQYIMMKEIFALLKKGEGVNKLNKLPETVDTLKRYVREELPLLEIRSQLVALNPDKLPSSRLHAAQIGGNIDQPKQDMYFFNPIELFKNILASTLAKSMHFGMAMLVDNPTEAYHSAQWAGSVRTTSGEFPYYPLSLDAQDPVFPGDFVEFRCAHVQCNTCRAKEGVADRGTHVGQVMATYRDYRTSRRLGGVTAPQEVPVDENSEGDIILVIGRLWSGKKLLVMNERNNIHIKINPAQKHDFYDQELVLVLDPLEYVSADNIVSRIEDVDFDYSFMSEHSFADDYTPVEGRRFIRRGYSRVDLSFMPMAKVSPVPGLLEMHEFGRDALVQTFAQSSKVRSLPVLTFADGFGLYRTMYKSIMGVYNEIAALPKAEHGRQINIFPLTLGPHGSNFADVVKALEPMKALDKGLVVKINGEQLFLCGPVLAFTGDMPQQQVNSGMLGVTANKGCRSCDISSSGRGDLDFDIVGHARGHFETLRQRRALDELMTTKAAKKKLSAELGISLQPSAVSEIAPALDVITTRPSDSAHSEFGGITKMLHQLLIDQAMKPQTVVEYARALRKMPFPPGWAAIQSPFHVLTYSLQEHARWSVLMTILARCWLREGHLKAPFVRAIRVVFASEIQAGQFGVDPTVVDILIGVLTATVRTNCLLGADKLDIEDCAPQTFVEIIYRGRQLFQKVCEAAALSSGPSRGTRGTSRSLVSTVRDPSAAPSESVVMATVEQDVEGDINVGHLSTSQKAVKYRQWASRPNVHVGLHYRDVFHRYGLVSLLMVLSGEMKHKQWKSIVTQTNHRSPERSLFEFENLVQTIRLALIDGFKHDEPEITAMLQDLSRTVPTMFAGLLPDSAIGISQADAEDLDNPSISIEITGDAHHSRPSALVRIKSKHCRELGLPVRIAEMSVAFRASLRDAYRIDYDKNVIAVGGPGFKWWKKVAFADSHNLSARRVVLHRGHYVAYRGGRKGRLDQFFVHETPPGSGTLYLFCVVTPTIELPGRIEYLTKLPIMQLSSGQQPLAVATEADQSAQEIIGLPAIEESGLYMVPFVQDVDGWSFVTGPQAIADEVLFVNWPIQGFA